MNRAESKYAVLWAVILLSFLAPGGAGAQHASPSWTGPLEAGARVRLWQMASPGDRVEGTLVRFTWGS